MFFQRFCVSSSLSRISRVATSRTNALATSTQLKTTFPASFFSSDSITYSGGQATEGQGGFYGSGGARKLDTAQTISSSLSDPRPQMLALAADVNNIKNTMNEVENLEQLLLEQETDNGITGKIIEIKSTIKKACTNPDFIDSLNRLELNGEPVWGLSGDEREMITNARSKVNEC